MKWVDNVNWLPFRALALRQIESDKKNKSDSLRRELTLETSQKEKQVMWKWYTCGLWQVHVLRQVHVQKTKFFFANRKARVNTDMDPQAAQAEPHKENNMASNYKGLSGIFYKISREVVKSKNSQ